MTQVVYLSHKYFDTIEEAYNRLNWFMAQLGEVTDVRFHTKQHGLNSVIAGGTLIVKRDTAILVDGWDAIWLGKE